MGAQDGRGGQNEPFRHADQRSAMRNVPLCGTCNTITFCLLATMFFNENNCLAWGLTRQFCMVQHARGPSDAAAVPSEMRCLRKQEDWRRGAWKQGAGHKRPSR